ncbi:hypothetical protein Efla_005443 [Eimeria flavescens]
MAAALDGLARPSRAVYLWFFCFLALALALKAAANTHDGGEEAGQSPRKRLELLVRGSPIADSTTTIVPEADLESAGHFEAEPVSEMSPADRFRLIVQSERSKDEDSAVALEVPQVLHPMKNQRQRVPANRMGNAAKLAAGVVPSVALFSQVLLGSRMKASVLEDSIYDDRTVGHKSLACEFCVPTAVDALAGDEPVDEGKWDVAKKALTSKTAIGITAVIAAIAGLILSKDAYDRWKRPKNPGLLNPQTAKWDLQQCLLIIDVHGAEDLGTLEGKYVANSASLKVDVSTQRATLSYARIPSFSKAMLKALLRKKEVVHEHFTLPAEHCFVSAPCVKCKTGSLESEGQQRPKSWFREYREKTTFGRERVAALAVRVERSPGLELLRKSSEDPGPPPKDLLDAIQLKHQTTGFNAVELEEPLSALPPQKVPEMQALEQLVSDPDVCGGAILCVDSVSISAGKNICTVHAAVEDKRPVSVVADVPLQTLSIVVGLEGFGAAERDSKIKPAEYHIRLPRHCLLGDLSRASYTVAPFAVDAEEMVDFTKPSVEGGGQTEGEMEEEDEAAAHMFESLQAALEKAALVVDGGVGDASADAAGDFAKKNRQEEEAPPPAAAGDGGAEDDNPTRVHYQHVRIQFRPLHKSALTTSLVSLPELHLSK